MGISEETRMNIGKMFDFKRDCIIPEGMHGGWQTSGTVYTVEGNSGDACKQRQYTVGSSNIYGYGIPAY